MATTVFGRATALAGQVQRERSDINPVEVLLTLLMAVPFVVGWTVGITVRGSWFVLSYVWAAGKVGYRTAQGDRRGG